MDQNDDFTFCQVGLPVTNDDIDQQKILPVGEISLEDKDGSYNGNGKDAIKGNFQGPLSTKKEESVGSFCFSASNASSQKQQSSSSGNAEPLAKGNQERTVARKPAPRAKVPFEKGYSQMDWLKLTRTHPDLAGLNGQSNRRLISMSEVKQHQSEGCMWTVLKGRVYNISPYMKFHPGGVDLLMKAVGKDCTSLFNKYHAWVNAEFLLEKCLVGMLDADGQ